MSAETRPAMLAARVTMGAARRLFHLLPTSLRQRVEDRFFYAVFHSTRITNDAYGWRPEQEGGSSPPSPGEEFPR